MIERVPAALCHHETILYVGLPALICSPAMREVMRLVERVALTNAAVLIIGESGCGKEVVARALHHHSLRCTKPWVDLSCAALPEHLIESELFGYEKGAFSGADSPKQGLFELAHTGTLFLDEIGELEPKMQVKLLRVLDATPYYRLGGLKKVSVDVRVVAATNQNLDAAIQAGGFRRDLYHRLSQVQIRVPPLRERVDDIAPLAEFFLEQHNPRMSLTREAIALLQSYSWPGNVRELRNVVIKSAILAHDSEICRLDLPPEIQDVAPCPHAEPADNLDVMERRMILQALSRTEGHQQKAARLLGISRRTLSRRLRAYEMQEAS